MARPAAAYKAGVKYANGEFIQVHPTAIPGTDKLRLMSESARGEGGRVWVPRKPQDDRDPSRRFPNPSGTTFWRNATPNTAISCPRDIATREIFDICVNHKLSVEEGRLCVYLDLTELPADTHKKLEGILEIYEKFQGDDPRTVPMKIFPAVHYSMGGLWVDYEKNTQTGGLVIGSPRNQHSNVPGLFVIGEADYQFHGANRLGANSLLSCIFSGLLVAPSIESWFASLPSGSAGDQPTALFDHAIEPHLERIRGLVNNTGGENPYLLHQELGECMTRSVTVVRNNKDLAATLAQVNELHARYQNISLSDTSDWTNQNLSFARAVGDMIVMARAITKGALLRDECRGAHYKPEFEIPAPDTDDPAELREQATTWCKAFKKKNDKWLKTSIAEHKPDGAEFTYEPVDTSLIPPRPRTYGLKGAEIIEEVWRDMTAAPSESV